MSIRHYSPEDVCPDDDAPEKELYTYCASCGRSCSEDEVYRINGRSVCDNCIEKNKWKVENA